MGRLFIIGLSLVFTLAACSGDDSGGAEGPEGPDGGVAFGYVGSDTCGTCHARQHAAWVNSGHPYKIVPKQDILDGTAYPGWVNSIVHGDEFAVDADFFDEGQAGNQMLSMNENTFPNGWDDITYAIGGYGWKARFIGNDGYIITGSTNTEDPDDDDKVQYNFPLEVDAFGINAYSDVPVSSATYHTDEKKPYDCGTCHTTGWIADDDAETDGDLSDNQDGLEGIWGTWEEPGVGCEACHGPGQSHSDAPHDIATQWNPATRCGNCHIRSDVYEIDTSGGFIKHHEQYEEVIQGTHSALQCAGCHDSHEPVRFGDTYVALDDTEDDPNPDFPNFHGVRVTCESCHFDEAESYAVWAANFPGPLGPPGMADVTCEQCHMPKATKSAVKAGPFYGDTSTHLFGVNTWVNPIDPSLDPPNALSTTGTALANPYISLDWACGSCHSDMVEEDPESNNLYNWALNALQSNGGVHGNPPMLP